MKSNRGALRTAMVVLTTAVTATACEPKIINGVEEGAGGYCVAQAGSGGAGVSCSGQGGAELGGGGQGGHGGVGGAGGQGGQ